jgi:hypothetical protein
MTTDHKAVDRLNKMATLALNGAATEGEWTTAAISFFRIARSKNVPVRLPIPSKPKRYFPVGRMPFGKYKGKGIEEIVAFDLSYLKWLLSRDISYGLRTDINRAIQQATQN